MRGKGLGVKEDRLVLAILRKLDPPAINNRIGAFRPITRSVHRRQKVERLRGNSTREAMEATVQRLVVSVHSREKTREEGYNNGNRFQRSKRLYGGSIQKYANRTAF